MPGAYAVPNRLLSAYKPDSVAPYNYGATTESDMATRLLHLREVLNRTSLSRSHTYRLIAEGAFPASVPLGSRVAWVESEVQAWIDARIEERAA